VLGESQSGGSLKHKQHHKKLIIKKKELLVAADTASDDDDDDGDMGDDIRKAFVVRTCTACWHESLHGAAWMMDG